MAFHNYQHQAYQPSCHPQPQFTLSAQHTQTPFTSTTSSYQQGQTSPMDTSGYLPPFLLGSPVAKSPSRSSFSRQLSSQGGRVAQTPGGTSLLDRSHLGGIAGSAPHHIGAGAVKPIGGPPVEGLYDHPVSIPGRTSTPYLTGPSPERRQLDFSVLNSAHRSGSTISGSSGPRVTSTPGTVGTFNNLNVSTIGSQRRTPPSPPQMDPFYTQGENLTSEDNYHDCWITVFGFPPAASSYILEQFSQYGTILKHVVTANGNWMHVHYQSRLQAKKALSKNGKVYGNGIMVGVQQCIDKSVMDGHPVSPTSHSRQPLTPANLGKKPLSIRPLTAAYQSAASQHQVTPANPNTPQKSNGFISKAFEYMFGW